jgi:hypothetical protein
VLIVCSYGDFRTLLTLTLAQSGGSGRDWIVGAK